MKKISPQDMMVEKMERVQRLVDGKDEPPNEFCAYLVKQIQQASAEGDAVQKSLQKHRESVAALETRAKEIRGITKKYIKDIQQWDRPAQPKTEPTENDKEAPPAEPDIPETPKE